MIEAVRGRWIGSKTWNRVVGIFGNQLDSPQTAWACCDVHEAGMAIGLGFIKWNRCWVIGREQ